MKKDRHISYVCPNCHWSLNRQEPDDDIYDIWVEQGTCQQNRQVAMRPATRDEKIVNPGVYEVPVFDCPRCGHCCPEREWENVTDDALIEEVRRRGFTIRDAQISPKIKDEYELCCQKYDTCTEPCTPRGKHLAKREWVGLTDEEAKKTFEEHNCVISADLAGILARAIEAKSKEKNT